MVLHFQENLITVLIWLTTWCRLQRLTIVETSSVSRADVSPPYKYPATVLVWFGGDESQGPMSLGGGTILNRDFVLTSASYLFYNLGDRNDTRVDPGLFVLTGVHDVKNLEPPVQNVSVVEVTFHELGPMYDIALLRVDPPIIFNNIVAPVNLPDLNFTINTDFEVKAVTTGWGSNTSTTEKMPNVLQEGEVTLVRSITCRQIWGEHEPQFRLITDFQLCAGAVEGGQGSCMGDQGSALYINELAGTFTQIGIVSFGKECGRKEYPSVYLDVSKYLHWIHAHARYCPPEVQEHSHHHEA